MKPGIHQLLPSLEENDAIGDYARRIQKIVLRMGFDSRIFVFNVRPGQTGCLPFRSHLRFSAPGNLLVFHTAIGSPLAEYFRSRPDLKVLVHHNVTPFGFLAGSDPEAAFLAYSGRKELETLAGKVDAAVADSSCNAAELTALGYPPPRLVPLPFDWERLAAAPDEEILRSYRDGATNLLFVGRIAPHKRQEDIIHAFLYYQNYFDRAARLFLVGDTETFPRYTKALRNLIERLPVRNVLIAGKVSPEALRAYYRLADAFVCLSEHEGFGVPLVESFFYRLPVVAFAAAAVPETTGGAGLLITEKEPLTIAALIHRVLTDRALKNAVLSGQDRRLEYFRSFPFDSTWESIFAAVLKIK